METPTRILWKAWRFWCFHCVPLVAVLTLTAFLFGCTSAKVRESVEERHFSVDWSQYTGGKVAQGTLELQPIILTPSQYPLEASFKRLLSGDFIGVVDAFDLRYHSTRIPEGAVQEVYDAGFLPVYLRVNNPTAAQHHFFPHKLRLDFADGESLPYVWAEELPSMIEQLDEIKTAQALVFALLIVVILVLAAKEGETNNIHLPHFQTNTVSSPHPGGLGNSGAMGQQSQSGINDGGLLKEMVLHPGESREGFVFFRMDGTLFDWPSISLATE